MDLLLYAALGQRGVFVLDIDVVAGEPSLAMLREAPSQLRDADYQAIKDIWETGEKLTDGSTNNTGDQPDPVRSRHPRPPVTLPVSGTGGIILDLFRNRNIMGSCRGRWNTPTSSGSGGTP